MGAPLLKKRHRFKVKALAWSPDGQRIASGGDDWTTHIWKSEIHETSRMEPGVWRLSESGPGTLPTRQ